jgi:isoleucyl-tRNA synthetase
MVFDSVAFKNVISNGLVLDKNGQKMSKRLGNGIDPFATLDKFGADATRWYMITNAQPWDNLKFDLDGITEIQRKFFGTLYNTYSFFSLYANIDGFEYSEKEIDLANRPEIDRWILSKLHSLIQDVDSAFAEFEPTKAGRFNQDFVVQINTAGMELKTELIIAALRKVFPDLNSILLRNDSFNSFIMSMRR